MLICVSRSSRAVGVLVVLVGRENTVFCRTQWGLGSKISHEVSASYRYVCVGNLTTPQGRPSPRQEKRPHDGCPSLVEAVAGARPSLDLPTCMMRKYG